MQIEPARFETACVADGSAPVFDQLQRPRAGRSTTRHCVVCARSAIRRVMQRALLAALRPDGPGLKPICQQADRIADPALSMSPVAKNRPCTENTMKKRAGCFHGHDLIHEVSLCWLPACGIRHPDEMSGAQCWGGMRTDPHLHGAGIRSCDRLPGGAQEACSGNRNNNMDRYTDAMPSTAQRSRNQLAAWLMLCGWLGASAVLLFNHMQDNPPGVCTTRLP